MNVALYVRVSTQEQAKGGHSIPEQQERLSKYASAMGWTVYDTYTDAGFSGTSTNRPALSKLIDDVEAGLIDKVIVYKLDRLSRSQKDTLYLIEDVFLAHQCDFISINENFDTSTAFGKAMIGILAVFAQLEREQIRERMIMGQTAYAHSGGIVGRCSIGYDYDSQNKTLIVNKYEAMQIKRIFKEYLSGKTITEITKDLNDAGYTHKYGKWIFTTVRHVLTSRVYLGETKYDGQWYKSNHQPLITEEMHDKSMSRINEMYENHQRNAGARSLLGGLLVCQRCGAKYTRDSAFSNGKKYSYYVCNSKAKKNPNLVKDATCKNKTWRMDVLDDLVLNEIRKLSLEPLVTSAPKSDTKKTLTQRISAIDRQVEKLIDLYSLGGISKEQIEKKVNSLNSEKSKLQRQISMERKNADLRQDKINIINSLDDIISHADRQDLRLVVTSLINKICIDGDDITIHWNI